jgi:hypothetical protein
MGSQRGHTHASHRDVTAGAADGWSGGGAMAELGSDTDHDFSSLRANAEGQKLLDLLNLRRS